MKEQKSTERIIKYYSEESEGLFSRILKFEDQEPLSLSQQSQLDRYLKRLRFEFKKHDSPLIKSDVAPMINELLSSHTRLIGADLRKELVLVITYARYINLDLYKKLCRIARKYFETPDY